MRYWLARLSFSFLIIAFVLGYEGYRLSTARGNPWAVRAYFLGAALSFVLAIVGTRYRHKN